jgi:hypothetical protein
MGTTTGNKGARTTSAAQPHPKGRPFTQPPALAAALRKAGRMCAPAPRASGPDTLARTPLSPCAHPTAPTASRGTGRNGPPPRTHSQTLKDQAYWIPPLHFGRPPRGSHATQQVTPLREISCPWLPLPRTQGPRQQPPKSKPPSSSYSPEDGRPPSPPTYAAAPREARRPRTPPPRAFSLGSPAPIGWVGSMSRPAWMGLLGNLTRPWTGKTGPPSAHHARRRHPLNQPGFSARAL